MKTKIANGCMILLMVLMVIAGVAGTNYLKKNKASTANTQGALASAQTESSKENDSREESIETDEKKEEQGSEKTQNEPEQPADAKADQSEKKSEKTPAKTDPSKEKQLDTSVKTDDEKDTEKQPAAKKESKKTPAAKKESTKKESTKKESLSCTITIRCDTILQNLGQLDGAKREYVPKNGCLLAKTNVTFEKGATVFDVLKQVCKKKKIQLEYSWTPVYNNYYIEGMGQLYEFDCGYESGWVYLVDGKQASYGCSSYKLKGGEEIVWAYSCQGQGADVTGSGR